MTNSPAPVIIREAQAQDAAQIIAHVKRLIAEPEVYIITAPGEFNFTVEQEQAFLNEHASSDNSVFLVAEIEGKIVGMLNCTGGTRRATRHAATLGMSVDREWRNQGVGSLLMARAVEWAKQSEMVSRIELSVFARNEMAIHLYQKYGFVVEGRRRKSLYRNGEYFDDLIMALLL